MENITDMEKFDERSTPQVPAVMGGVSLVQMAMQKNYDPAFIEKMMDLQERNDARVAKQAYVAAMAEFKKNAPKIMKDSKVSFQAGNKTTEYSHANLATASGKINAELSKHGLSAGWKTEQQNGNIIVTCTITHKLGHSESTSLSAQPDTSGSKNAIQAMGSTISYLERYTLLALTGLAAHDQDDDGNSTGTPVEYITLDQQTEINDFFDVLYTDNGKKFLKWLGAKSVDTIPIEDYKNAIDSLKDIKAERKKPKREPGDES